MYNGVVIPLFHFEVHKATLYVFNVYLFFNFALFFAYTAWWKVLESLLLNAKIPYFSWKLNFLRIWWNYAVLMSYFYIHSIYVSLFAASFVLRYLLESYKYSKSPFFFSMLVDVYIVENFESHSSFWFLIIDDNLFITIIRLDFRYN